jgi:UTP--glucose-1-phosphate uridylyltransferase
MSNIDLFIEKMQRENLNPQTIDIFRSYYGQIERGEKGKLSRDDITTPSAQQIVSYSDLSDDSTKNLYKLAVVKLNGGLGTSMGLSQAKSLLPVKTVDGEPLNFLDIIALQTLKSRQVYNVDLPVIFMNSFNTSSDTLDFLKKYPALGHDKLPLDFIQNKFPKVRKDNLRPLENAVDTQNWNPPGHGDIYNALSDSTDGHSLLDILIDEGYEYIFVANSDNLGAIVDTRILNKLFEDKIDFAMEVCHRTEMDKKGGHLACSREGKLLLREVAQCPVDEIDDFQNIELYKYFNTNNLWINLPALKQKLAEHQDVLPLNLIINEKKVDDVAVYQIETAMGAAINVFDKARAVCVPRSRFLPVKKNQDLLLLWSDGYELTDDFILRKKAGAKDTILELRDEYYGCIGQLQKACEECIPSLHDCELLSINGFIRFPKGTVYKGRVEIS